METKKRHVADDSEVSLPKKRALADAHGSPTPHANGAITDEPKDANLEYFRKEAIYRRMQHYSRECERGQARIAELERWQTNCEAGIATLEACWTQLLDTTKSLMQPEDASRVQLNTNDVFDLSVHVSDEDSSFATALRGKAGATKELLTSIVQRGAPALLQDQVYLRAQTAQAECTTLRAELVVLRERLKRADADKARFHAELVAAEKHADRARSQTVAQMNGHGSSIPKLEQDAEPVADISLKPDPGAVPSAPPLLTSVSEQVEGLLSEPMADWIAIADLRGQKISELDGRLKDAHLEIKNLMVETEMPSDSKVKTTAVYNALSEHAVRLEHETGLSQGKLDAVEVELRALRETRTQYEEAIQAEAAKAVLDLKAVVERRDKDIVRLREQRDQQLTELNERKQRDAVKHMAFEELKALADSRSERITVYQMETTRLKAQLAANAGNEALLSFFLRDTEGDISFLGDLQNRLAASESRSVALEQSIVALDKSSPDVAAHCRAEADVRAQLNEAQRELSRCRAILGDASESPSDVAQLVQQLKVKEEEAHALRLQVDQQAKAETSSWSEVERLSTQWEELDKQVKNKVFDLKAMEDRVTRATADRSKLEGKYWAAMRDKESSENERKNLTRNVEKQAKAMEKLTSAEKSLQSQVSEHDKVVEAYEHAQSALKARLNELGQEVNKWRSRAEDMKNRCERISKQPCEGCKDLSAQSTKAQQLQEDAIRMKEKAEKLIAKAKATPAAPKSSRESQLQAEVDKCMSILKCSTCKMRMRSTVITKCMHSFCKECVDARIATRQRKCPACNLAFGQADVQQLFFQ